MNSKELTELIHQNTRIILPEFGAFLVKDSGEKGFNPSNVSFSPFLRYNDGMLEVYVAKKRGISKEEASKDVHEFVENLKNELLEKGSFEVDGLGHLMRDQRGSLSFSLAQADEKRVQVNKIIADEPIGMKEDPVEIIQTTDNNDEKNDVWITNDNPIDDDDFKKPRKISGVKAKVEKLTVTKKTTKATKKVDELQQEPIQVDQAESAIEIELEPEIIPIEETIIKAQPEEKTIEVVTKIDENLESQIPTPQKKEIKKKNSYVGLLYTAVAIGVVVILFFIIRNYYLPPNIETANDSLSVANKHESTINDKVETNDKVEKPKDEIDKAFIESTNDDKSTKELLKKEKEQEDAIANTLIKNAQIKHSENKTATGTKFHIIAGSFKNPDFAKKFLNELNTSGYKASIVIQPSGMNAVTIGSYATREEANEAMKGYKSKLPNLWILKK